MATLKEHETDVLVIGAGNAALVAAETAYDAGLKVTVLERAPKERRGGNSAFSGGLFRFAFKDFEHVKEIIKDSPGIDFKERERGALSHRYVLRRSHARHRRSRRPDTLGNAGDQIGGSRHLDG